MNVDPYSSDSSSWSLVDVEEASDSELDSIGGNLVVESVHDSDVESESGAENESEEEVDVAEEALEEDEVKEVFHDDESDVESLDEDVDGRLDVGVDEDVDGRLDGMVDECLDGRLDRETDEDLDGHRDVGVDEDVDGGTDEDSSESEEEDTVEILEESEAMEDAAKHFVEPTKVAQKLEELSKSVDSPFDKFMEKISSTDNVRFLAFLVVVVATFIGAGLGHYIGACLVGNRSSSMETGAFCLESERAQFVDLLGNPGLQYQESPKDHFRVPQAIEQVDPLVQCREKLDDANAQVRMKQGVNKFVRESYKRQLQRTKEEFEARLALYKRASRQLLATKYAPQISNFKEFSIKNSKIKEEIFSPICSLAEKKLMNLTKSIFYSFSNWTSYQPVVQNLVKYSPSFDESLEKVSAWLRTSKNLNNVVNKVHSLTKIPQLSTAVFDSMPKKIEKFVKSDLRNFASRATTALMETNLSSLVSEYRGSFIFKNFQKKVKSAFKKFKKFSLSKLASEVCFVNPCRPASILATVIQKNSELMTRLGKNKIEEYVRFLKSIQIQNCSQYLECQRDWWMGCGPQFMENCELMEWQEKRFFSGAALMNRRQDMKQVAVDLGWIKPKNRRSSVKCPRLSSAPLPCPADRPLPSLLPEPLAPCHPGPNSAKPCQSTIPLPRPCSKNRKFNKPSGDGRPDWFTQRAQVREKQRIIQNPKPSKKPSPQQRRTSINFSQIRP